MSQSQEVEQYTPQQQLVAQMRSDEFKSQLALALPENVTPDRFVRIAITALQANPSIAELERPSVHRALLHSAAMGLMPDGREAAVVPFKGKAQLIPMIAGFRKIAGEYGWTIYTAIAYENDHFEYEQGLDVRFRHVPVRPGAERGEPIAAYAVGKHQDGRRELEVLTVEEVEKIRATSQTAQKADGPWTQWWEQMAEKSAGKRLFKKLPLSEDDKRVRLISAALDPADAAAALYGNGARAAFPENVNRETGEITSGADSPTTDAGQAAAPGDQQVAAAVAPEEPTPSPSAAAAPDDDPEPKLEDDDTASFGDQVPAGEAQELLERAKQLGETPIPSGDHAIANRTIADVAALGGNGEKWCLWALKPVREWNQEGDEHAAFGEAIRTYVEIMLPDVWTAYQEWLAEQQEG